MHLFRHPGWASAPAPAPAPFSLTNYGELSLWLDATDVAGTGTNPANGSTVTTWVNKASGGTNASTFGNPAFSSTGLNGRPCILSATSKYIRGAISPNTGTTCTAFVVATMDGDATTQYGRLLSMVGNTGFDYSGTSPFIPFVRNTPQTQSVSSWRGAYMSTKSIPAYDTAFYATSVADGTNITNYVNGVAGNTAASSGSFNLTQYGIGSQPTGGIGDWWVGALGEFIVYKSALSSSDRQAVESYLANKWGISG